MHSNIGGSTIRIYCKHSTKVHNLKKVVICMRSSLALIEKNVSTSYPFVKVCPIVLHSKGIPSTASDKDSQLFATLSAYSCSSRANFLTA